MKYCLLAFIAFLLTSCVTLIPNEIENGKLLSVMPMQYGRVSYQRTFNLTADRENAFRQARRWAAFNMANPAQVLSVSDNQLGDIITRGAIGSTRVKTKNGATLVPSIEYAVSVECMDNKYRVTLTNFFINSIALPHGIEFRSSDVPKKRERDNLKEIDGKVMAILSDIQDFIEGEVKGL